MSTGWLDEDPQRVMGRLAQIFILLGLWPFLKRLQLADRTALGYGIPKPGFRRALALGWVEGVAILRYSRWPSSRWRFACPTRIWSSGPIWRRRRCKP
jgi:hypothetical protein